MGSNRLNRESGLILILAKPYFFNTKIDRKFKKDCEHVKLDEVVGQSRPRDVADRIRTEQCSLSRKQ